MGSAQSQLENLVPTDIQRNYISFFVNGIEHNVRTDGCEPDIGPKYLLVDYLRDKIGLTGTKYMCRAGGCGSCVVTIKSNDSTTGKQEERSVNSCLLPLFACDGLDITTVEALGNKQVGYSQLQERLVQYGGTQCGFCTPGFVMNMHSLAQSNPQFTSQDVEYSFDGNICRCTGYRPIMEAFKSLSSNPSEELKWKCADIEDMYKCPLKSSAGKDAPQQRTRKESRESMEIIQIPRQLYLKSSLPEQWFKVTKLSTLYELLESFANARTNYRLVAGFTGMGVYPNDGPYDAYIEINDIPELNHTSVGQSGIVLGGGVTLTTAIDVFERADDTYGFVYARPFFDHFRRVANLPVRNRGTLGGNLMLKHMHRDFRSDPFTLLESVGATLTIGSSLSLTKHYSLLEFLELDMRGKIILSISLPPIPSGQYFYRSYKVGKRYQNSVAYINAGFLFNIDPSTATIISRPRICYGGVNPNFVHANGTELYLKGKRVNVSNLQGAINVLENEVRPDFAPEYGTIQYRRDLTQALLYRFFLWFRGSSVSPWLISGAEEIHREINTAKQTFDTDRSVWPVNQPVPKLESFPQASGEAEYINDIRAELDELFGVFVVSTVGNATLKTIDASEALLMPGIVDFITARDIPGANNYMPFGREPEEIFATSRIHHAGQPLGLLVARDKYSAFSARSSVKVRYENISRPVLDLEDAIHKLEEKNEGNTKPDPAALVFPCRNIDVDKTRKIIECNEKRKRETFINYGDVTGSLHTIKGEFRAPAAYHMHMENQIAICVPVENGLKIYSSTQHMDAVQLAVSASLNVPNNSVYIQVRRCGGGFGAKLSKASLIACAAAIASTKTGRTVRVALDLETNMQMIGKRLPYLVKYETKVDDTGKIHEMDAEIWCDTGAVPNEVTSLYAMICSQSCYRADNWNIEPKYAVTNTPPNTYMRGPGSAQGASVIEHIMDHVAFTLKLEPLQVRTVNFIKKGDPLIGVPGAKLPLPNLVPGMLKELKAKGDYESRKRYVEKFNKENRWRKRGISVVCLRFPAHYQEFRYPAFISVYHADGSVNVSHAGMEIGQGVNTKVAQVVSLTLQIPLEKVKIQPSDTLISPNTALTAGSTASELVCESARRACLILLKKLEPIRKQLENPTWEQLIAAANAREILLTAQFQETADLTAYDIYGTTMIEVELDCLTGDYKIVRADIIEDCGRSLNPLIDIGQVEGAFVMGLGWWLTEELIYDQETGQLLTDSTWHYKPPLPADIPEDFRVTLLRNVPNPYGVLSSKGSLVQLATAEPPMGMCYSVVLALRHAINSARQDAGNHDWYQMDVPVTREVIRKACLTSSDQFTF